MNIRPGATLGPWRHEVDPEPVRRMAHVLGDPNPIHLDPGAARALGLGDNVVNQGPNNLAYIFNLLEETAPGAYVEELDVRLMASVVAGDTVEARGSVEEVLDGQIRCKVWLDVVPPEPAASSGDSRRRRALEGHAVICLPNEARQ
jgi:acyl dehydratase